MATGRNPQCPANARNAYDDFHYLVGTTPHVHCGEHLGEDRESCDIFVFTEFSDDRIEIEATVGGVLSMYTYTK